MKNVKKILDKKREVIKGNIMCIIENEEKYADEF